MKRGRNKPTITPRRACEVLLNGRCHLPALELSVLPDPGESCPLRAPNLPNYSRFTHLPRGSGEASGTYAFLLITFSCIPLRQITVFPMPSPGSPVLQYLRRLDRSISDFQDRLSNALYAEEYVQCVPNLRGDDLMWLVDYLDKVPRYFAVPTHCSNQRRLSMVSILPALLSGSVYANLEAYVESGGYSQRHTNFCLT